MKKKVLILQSKGRQVGGVWFVNRTLAEGLADRGYEVEVLCVRNNPIDMIPKHKDSIKVCEVKNIYNLIKIDHEVTENNNVKFYGEENEKYIYFDNVFILIF